MSKPVYLQVKERDLWRCRVCGTGSDLEVHHIVYRSAGGPDEAWNLITLCQSHHRAAHGLTHEHIWKWELHMLAGVPLMSLKTARRALASGQEMRTCLSCDRRSGEQCLIFDQQVSWDYSCSNWKLREED